MRQLALAIQDVDGNENHAQLDAGEIQIDHLQAVREVDAKPVAGFETAMSQKMGQPVTAIVDFAEGVASALKFERDLAAPALE